MMNLLNILGIVEIEQSVLLIFKTWDRFSGS